MHTLLYLLLGAGVVLLEGCSRPAADAQNAPAKPPIDLAGGPIAMTLRQRSEIPIPGSSGKVRVRIGDITRGQVLTTIVNDPSAGDIAGPRSVSVGESLVFNIEGHGYQLALTNLSNALIGEDFAGFVVSHWQDNLMTEEEKILLLIASIREKNGAIFLRNGREYDSVEAAEHLHRKWEMERDRIQTAKEFIQGIATASSISGKPYRIRLPDGHEVESPSFLKERLREIETGPNRKGCIAAKRSAASNYTLG